MEEQITETGTDGLTAPSADELRAVEEISEEAQQEMATVAGVHISASNFRLMQRGGYANPSRERSLTRAVQSGFRYICMKR